MGIARFMMNFFDALKLIYDYPLGNHSLHIGNVCIVDNLTMVSMGKIETSDFHPFLLSTLKFGKNVELCNEIFPAAIPPPYTINQKYHLKIYDEYEKIIPVDLISMNLTGVSVDVTTMTTRNVDYNVLEVELNLSSRYFDNEYDNNGKIVRPTHEKVKNRFELMIL